MLELLVDRRIEINEPVSEPAGGRSRRGVDAQVVVTAN